MKKDYIAPFSLIGVFVFIFLVSKNIALAISVPCLFFCIAFVFTNVLMYLAKIGKKEENKKKVKIAFEIILFTLWALIGIVSYSETGSLTETAFICCTVLLYCFCIVFISNLNKRFRKLKNDE